MSLESFFINVRLTNKQYSEFETSLQRDIKEIKNNSWKIYRQYIKFNFYDDILCFEGGLLNFIDSCIDIYSAMEILFNQVGAYQFSIGGRRDVEFDNKLNINIFTIAILQVFLPKYISFRESFGRFALNSDTFYAFKRKNKKIFLA